MFTTIANKIGRVAAGAATLLLIQTCAAQEISNSSLVISAQAQQGTYTVATPARKAQPVVTARVAAEIDGHWVRSNDYPQHAVAQSSFSDALGGGKAIRVTCSGLSGKPDLIYTLQIYDGHPYGTVQVELQNHTSGSVTVQALRSAEATGSTMIDLGARESADRILSDSFSEDWPVLVIYDLGKAPNGMHRGAGSQVIYNRESKQSLFYGALTAARFLTLLHLSSQGQGDATKVTGWTVDSTGTTEIQKENALRRQPATAQIDLSLPLAAGATMASERVMVQTGNDYKAQLLTYGEAIKVINHARVEADNLIGWWSWTSYYMMIDEGAALANAQFLADNLKSMGFNYFHLDEGYQYARGEFATPNAPAFPHGMAFIGDNVRRLGLTFGVWTAPFEVTTRAYVYENHKDWLVHDANGQPFSIGTVSTLGEPIFALDTTNPGAQEYLRYTYRTLTRDWGVRYIKLDFMDTSAVEGYHYRPNTTALEAQRLGLEIIRQAVGEDVILDKDGSPMLTPVGLVEAGRISADTRHTFKTTQHVEPGIAARFYMNRNFYMTDPDAFNVTAAAPAVEYGEPVPPVNLEEAQASIALSAVSGGMYEIGDDLPLLAKEKERMDLVRNVDLLNMAKLGKSSIPIDLLSYSAEDGQPAIFFLQEEPRQSIVTVFNWADERRSHHLPLSSFGLPAGHKYVAYDVLHGDARVNITKDEIAVDNQNPHSVRILKLVDQGIPASAPQVHATVPTEVKLTELFHVSAQNQPGSVPATSYKWDFGDGTNATGNHAMHGYTIDGDYTVKLTTEGLDGMPGNQTFHVKVTGALGKELDLKQNRRYVDPGAPKQ